MPNGRAPAPTPVDVARRGGPAVPRSRTFPPAGSRDAAARRTASDGARLDDVPALYFGRRPPAVPERGKSVYEEIRGRLREQAPAVVSRAPPLRS
ncbi:hypothetical protein [Streptomyces solaniscabiei]|uniref:hypothetical protein n=1 Tax=Streptomyces solaniscabiei TaxID=2683255 RepID=UPI001CE250C4|nr:hypothetical protein [Streptomyces solaniscabiei]